MSYRVKVTWFCWLTAELKNQNGGTVLLKNIRVYDVNIIPGAGRRWILVDAEDPLQADIRAAEYMMTTEPAWRPSDPPLNVDHWTAPEPTCPLCSEVIRPGTGEAWTGDHYGEEVHQVCRPLP